MSYDEGYQTASPLYDEYEPQDQRRGFGAVQQFLHEWSRKRGGTDKTFKEWGESRPLGVPENTGYSMPEYEDIDIPDWLKQMSEEGYGSQRLRDLYMSQAVPMSSKYEEGKRYQSARHGLTGIKDSGFQKREIGQIEAEKQSALHQLWSGVEGQSDIAKQQAIERIKNVDYFNKRMRESYEQFGEEKEFELSSMRQDYVNQMRQMRAEEQAAESNLWGAISGNVPMWAMMLL